MAPTYVALSLLASFSEAARFTKKANKTAQGIVDELYTFGAPKVSAPEYENFASSDGCFPGYRVVNVIEKAIWDVDVVPAGMATLSYVHPNIPTLLLNQKGGSTVRDCGDNPKTGSVPNADLHDKSLYVSRSEAFGDAALSASAVVGLELSYEADLNTVRSEARKHGWRLVGSASAGEDVSHLFQHPGTLACQISFEGSDTPDDFITDAKVKKVKFCGRGGVHLGFSNELKRLASNSDWQTNVKSKLSGCSSVTATGHSLGGAVATLFAGCVNSAKDGDADYDKLAFSRGSAVPHPEI
jgi:hypothetical protein